MEYLSIDYWEDYKDESLPVYVVPDYRLMRLLEEAALVVEENKRLKEALDFLISFPGIPQAIKDEALETIKEE